jgi:tetratricopeptide (TPR) repeat protein
MGHYPFEWQEKPLYSEDFIHFQTRFSSTILQHIPFAYGPVTFLDPTEEPGDSFEARNKPKYWIQYCKKVLKQQRAVQASEKPVLFLPVWGADTIVGVAVIEGVDEQFTNTLSEEWLRDRSRIISREFFLLKQMAYEPMTGMLNGRHIQDALDNALSEAENIYEVQIRQNGGGSSPGNTSLLLLEIHPQANNAEKALNYIIRAGYYLESFVGQDVLHHLGNGVFGLIGQKMDEEQAQKLGKNILSWFRREGFSRIHIGIITIKGQGTTLPNEKMVISSSFTVLEQAWNALRKARRRGPFALCTYSSISQPETHPLRRTQSAVMARLRKLWTDYDRFAILLISQDRELHEKVFPRRILALIEPQIEIVTINQSEIFAFIPNADASKAISWARKFREKLPEDLDTTYSIGIAYFPCIDFCKPDIPHNARKALLHSGFYGPDTVTVFDGISQNVSGDIYYGEGDIVRAVKEYRKGLELEPGNTNLLNSLGEAYAQMSKTKKARSFFESIIQSDPKHYMALFNLGVTYLTTGEDEQAIGYFEKALAVSKHTAEANQRDDLLLQLGKLYCRAGRYKKALKLLEKEKITAEAGSMTPGKALLRYLGEAYKETGNHKKAMIALQHAISYNPHDAYAMSMLGELYAVENQGDDIALSLCQQAVNIDDSQWKHWYRLGWIRYKMALYEPALEALKECLHRERKNPDVFFLTGQIYEKVDAKAKATAMFQRAVKIAPEHRAAVSALKRITII